MEGFIPARHAKVFLLMKGLERMESSSEHRMPETIEQAQDSKKEIEDRVAKIFKLVKYNDKDKKGKIPEESKRRLELIGLIEDFKNQYESLHAQYDNLKGALQKQASGREEKESLSSTSSSDLDYYSSEDIDIDNLTPTHVVTDSTKNIFIVDEKKHSASFGVESLQKQELERKLLVLTGELEPLHNLKNELAAQLDKKSAEAKQLGDRNIQLQRRIAELESVLKEKADEVASVTKKQQDSENLFKSKIEDLTAHARNLQQELESVRSQRSSLEDIKRKEALAQIKGLKDRIKAMQQKMYAMRNQKTEVEILLDQKTKEIAENMTLIETLKGEIQKKTLSEKESLKGRESYAMQEADLEQVMQSLCNDKNKLEEVVRSQNQEICQLREENDRYQARVFELEDILSDGGDEPFTFHKKPDHKENEASSQLMIALQAEVNSMEQELVSLRSKNNNLEMCIERLKHESSKNQTQLENQVRELTSQVAEQQRTLQEREEVIKKLTEERKAVKPQSTDACSTPRGQSFDSSSLNNQKLNRKVEELAGRFEMKMENHIRLLYQRILVSEQMHLETKEGYRKFKDRVVQESKALKEKVALCEAELRQISDLLVEPGIGVMTGMDSAAMPPDDDDRHFLNRISRILRELQFAKNWIAVTNAETKKIQHHVDSLTTQLEGKEEKEMLLKKKVWKLEAKLSKEGGDKLNVVSQLERKVGEMAQQLKEKNEILAGLGEEKREAIRQLCVLIDYHRSRFDELKETMSNMTFRIKRTA
ncbi:hypothetical protein Tsubulata_005666 [Turnera subulata]|uniref:NAB domain-containing protein n=1 Tax=Turnera subulata TaxID=218843 RepID=A0A9Q0F2I6_9ROSI|nr:hypothetical protein Tsubulata_005666 [Turnera subulata]